MNLDEPIALNLSSSMSLAASAIYCWNSWPMSVLWKRLLKCTVVSYKQRANPIETEANDLLSESSVNGYRVAEEHRPCDTLL